jgi:hypothetical protein
MATQTRPKMAETEYVLAPWHLRLIWWLTARLWGWGRGLLATSAEAPDLASPLWRR